MTKKDKQISVRLDPELRSKLAAAADEDDRKLASMVRCVLRDWAAKRETEQRGVAA